jgi:predicted DNA binding CopG/RHH family protein
MEKRDKLVPVRLSSEEEKIITEKANKLGLKLSTYLRLSALEKQQ